MTIAQELRNLGCRSSGSEAKGLLVVVGPLLHDTFGSPPHLHD